MTIGVAILGGGIFAREEHKPAVSASKDLVLKAIYSRSLKSAQSLQTDASVDLYSDDSCAGKSRTDLLARKDIHAVIIALPIKNQPVYVREALLAGKHVLSEKPVAETVDEACQLIEWYEKEIQARGGPTWGVAENFRYLDSLDKAVKARSEQGRVLTFRIKQQRLITGGKYFETSWRKDPTHQGGFLLDGGVHFTAAIRLLLGKEDPIVTLSAQTAQLQSYLPPVDTIEATAKTRSGAVGSMSISFGTTDSGSEYTVASEKGVVTWDWGKVVVDGKVIQAEKDKSEGSGVTPEVIAWGKALAAGESNARQSPREALADLELIEASLKSGEHGGQAVELKHQAP